MKPNTIKGIKEWLVKNRAALLVFAIYLVITFIAVLFHENWEDEAQAWLTARDCSPIELIGRMKYEGHFLPWYLILMPFAKLGFPYITTNIVSWLITASAAWLMLKHLPCKFYKRVIFIFMLPMIYLYPAISRCYCLLPLGTILAIMFYKDRFKRPLRYLFSILIIANVHIYTFMFALVMGIEYLVDWIRIRKKLSHKQNRLIMCGMTGAIILVALAFLPLVGSVGANSVSDLGLKKYDNPLKELFINAPIYFSTYVVPSMIRGIIYCAIIFLVVWEFFTRKTEFIKIAIPIVWQCFIYCFIFGLVLAQRVVIPVFIILFFVSCRSWREDNKQEIRYKLLWKRIDVVANLIFTAIAIWITIDTGNYYLSFLAFFSLMFLLISFFVRKRKSYYEKYYGLGKKLAKAMLVFLALTQVYAGLTFVRDEIDTLYSDSKIAADFINDNISDDSIFLTSQESSMPFTAIVPYLRVQNPRFYNINYQTFYTFAIQPTSNLKNLLAPKAIQWARYCSLGKELYYLTGTKQTQVDIFDQDNKNWLTANLEEEGILEEVFDIYIDGVAESEYYTIYKVNPRVCK